MTAVLLACLLLGVALAANTDKRRHILEHAEVLSAPAGWTQINDAEPSARLTITLALKQRNIDELQAALLEVSDPNHPNYGKHWTNANITHLVSPHPDTIRRVLQWLGSEGLYEFTFSANTDFLTVKLSVAEAEKLLEIDFAEFRHTKTGKQEIRSLQPYSIPEALKGDIDFISGVHYFTPQLWHHSKKTLSHLAHASNTTNAPLLARLSPGSTRLGVFVGLKCSDGSIKSAGCTQDIKSVNIYLNGEKKFDADVDCQPCSSWTGSYFSACNYTDSWNKADNDAVQYCLIHVKDLPNYEAFSLSLSTQFYMEESDVFHYSGAVVLSEWVSPQSLKSYYGIPQGAITTHPGATQSVAEFLGQYYSTKDLQNWFSLMGLEDRSNQVIVKGPNNETNPGGEAQLDIEFIMGVAPNSTTYFWSLPGLNNDQQEPFLEWILEIQNTPAPPLVSSVSYDDQENTIHVDYINRVETEFMKAGLRGLSLLFASGDDGCGGYFLRDDPNACSVSSPAWPGTSPWITSVGGTQFSVDIYPWCSIHTCNQVGEIVSSSKTGSRITTGGGFSNLFPRPAYQYSAVTRYLANAKNLPPTSFFNETGRAYPDISAVAHNYLVQLEDQLIGVDGTSASTPTIAAMITLLNNKLLMRGRPPLGFLNPWLYNSWTRNPSSFMDITVGNNACSANPANCCPYGFPAAPGWDASTGLGTPNFNILFDSLN